jgi:hypothetical protein
MCQDGGQPRSTIKRASRVTTGATITFTSVRCARSVRCVLLRSQLTADAHRRELTPCTLPSQELTWGRAQNRSGAVPVRTTMSATSSPPRAKGSSRGCARPVRPPLVPMLRSRWRASQRSKARAYPRRDARIGLTATPPVCADVDPAACARAGALPWCGELHAWTRYDLASPSAHALAGRR